MTEMIIDTPEGIAFYQLCVHIKRLQIEVRTGMRSRVNTLAAAQARYGITSKTKQGAIVELERLREEVLAGTKTLAVHR